MASLRELQEQRSTAATAMRTLAELAEAEQRDLTAAEDHRFDELKVEIGDLDKKIERRVLVDDAERRSRSVAVLPGGRVGDNYATRASEFRITTAIAAALGEDVDAGLEREVSAEVKRRSGRTFAGIAVPDQAFLEHRGFGDDVMLSGGGGAAAPLYPTVHRPDLFIDRLRSALIVERLGATVLSDLQGDQDIPRQSASATAQWLSEDEALTDSNLDFDDVSLTPHTVGAVASYSRRTLINASPSIEAIVRGDLARVIAAAIDRAALFGTGASNTPVGVLHQVGVLALSLAGPTWEQVLSFPAEIALADADLGGQAWAMAPDAIKILRSTLKVPAEAAGGYLMTDPSNLAGYPVVTSTALTTAMIETGGASTVIFGSWSQLLVGYWSGVDLLVNPYADSAFSRARVLIRVMRDCDVAVRHPESFAHAEID